MIEEVLCDLLDVVNELLDLRRSADQLHVEMQRLALRCCLQLKRTGARRSLTLTRHLLAIPQRPALDQLSQTTPLIA